MIEVRPDADGQIDEIVAADCSVHIERMDIDAWFIGVSTKSESYRFWLRRCNDMSVRITLTERQLVVTPR